MTEGVFIGEADHRGRQAVERRRDGPRREEQRPAAAGGDRAGLRDL